MTLVPADDFNYDKSKSLRPRRNIRMAMQREVTQYAIAQKEVRCGSFNRLFALC